MDALQTKRLLLRPLGESHVQSMHELCVHPDVRRYLFKDRLIPVAEVESMVATSQSCFDQMGLGFFAVFVAEEGHPSEGLFVGFCGVRYFDEGPSIELLLGMNPTIWGRGFGQEAGRAVLESGFGEHNLGQIIAAAGTPNQRSIRVLQKLGMSFRERRQWHRLDTMFYEISSEDYHV